MMVREMSFHNPYYEENLYGPAKDELFIEQLTVLEGQVPNDIYGAYIRNGPNPKHDPKGRYHWFDVGGTFTDAVAIDGDSYEIIAQAKIPTTHDDSDGVAKGIIKILQLVLENANADPSEVTFISHGTTQATNALLEGDTATVGIVALGDGIISGRGKSARDLLSEYREQSLSPCLK